MGVTSYEQPSAKRPTIKRQVWDALDAHYKKTSKLHLRQLFADDPERGERMAVEAVGLYLDYSKKITREDAVAEIARRYRKFVGIFENVRAQTRAA